MITATASYLGPAEILTVAGKPGYVQVRVPTEETYWARLAFATPYSPQPGDEVLVMCQEQSDAYVIGVLSGVGVTNFQVPGDLTLSAPHGHIRFVAGKSVQVRSAEMIEMTAPKATLRMSRLNIFATTLVERIGNGYTWVSGLLQFKSRRMRTVTDESWLVRSGRVHLKASGNTCINGKTVHLG